MELLERIADGENSRVEFKRDGCHPDDLAAEMAALLNLEGGFVLLGVEDGGHVSKLTGNRGDAEEWVMNVARENVQPAVIPSWICMETEGGKEVGVIELAAGGPGKPYKARRGRAWVTHVRVGGMSREATREEEGRIYRGAGPAGYVSRAVPDTGLESLDMDRIENYHDDVMKIPVPDRTDLEGWQRLLVNSNLLVAAGDGAKASVSGLLLFGEDPNRRLPQAGVTAAAFGGLEKDDDAIDEERIRGPLTSRVSNRGAALEKGVIDRAVDFATRNMGGIARLEGARRRRKKSFPVDAVREAIVNAVVHRDYAREGTDVELSLYRDRMEIISPGRLPDAMTVEKMREGVARNGPLKEILRDYGCAARQGTGVRNRIVESMRRHNETEPDLVEEDDRFVVRLFKRHG